MNAAESPDMAAGVTTFSAVYLIGFFDSVDEMHEVYEAHSGVTELEAGDTGFTLVR